MKIKNKENSELLNYIFLFCFALYISMLVYTSNNNFRIFKGCRYIKHLQISLYMSNLIFKTFQFKHKPI